MFFPLTYTAAVTWHGHEEPRHVAIKELHSGGSEDLSYVTDVVTRQRWRAETYAQISRERVCRQWLWNVYSVGQFSFSMSPNTTNGMETGAIFFGSPV